MQPTISSMKEEVPLVKRFIMVLAAMGLMVAMLVALAMPALADKGGSRGHETSSGGCVNGEFERSCDFSRTQAGGSKDSEFHGRKSVDESFTDDYENLSEYDQEARTTGGGKDTGGGNCTSTTTLDPETGQLVSSEPEGHGSRC